MTADLQPHKLKKSLECYQQDPCTTKDFPILTYYHRCQKLTLSASFGDLANKRHAVNKCKMGEYLIHPRSPATGNF
jgi:hypothetical protein